MSALTHALVHSTPREKAGAQTAAKYNFQWNYSLLKIIELHSTDADYRVLFEHFDDVIVLSPANDPTTAESYQVKGRATGRWTAVTVTVATTPNPPLPGGPRGYGDSCNNPQSSPAGRPAPA